MILRFKGSILIEQEKKKKGLSSHSCLRLFAAAQPPENATNKSREVRRAGLTPKILPQVDQIVRKPRAAKVRQKYPTLRAMKNR
jgi:hypothetical protein